MIPGGGRAETSSKEWIGSSSSTLAHHIEVVRDLPHDRQVVVTNSVVPDLRSPGVASGGWPICSEFHAPGRIRTSSRHVGDPILESNITRRVDFALFMVEALKNDELIHEAPAIVGRLEPSALAHADSPVG